MIKKLKLGLLIAVFSLTVGVYAVHADDLTFTDPTTISIGGNHYVIQAGSTATSLVVDTSAFTVTVPANSTFTVVSSDGYALNNNGGFAQTCNNSGNTLSVVGPSSGPVTVLVTPNAVACSGGSTGGGGLNVSTVVSGGGGGGNSTPPVTLTVSPTVTVTPTAMTISGCDNRTTGFSTVNGQSCSGNTATVTVTTPVVIAGCVGTTGFSNVNGQSCAANGGSMTTSMSYNFGTTTLKNGSKGDGVKQLQMFLNKYLKLGLKLDGKLGPKTIAVIKKWQKDNGLVADGMIGAKTKAMMNAYASTH